MEEPFVFPSLTSASSSTANIPPLSSKKDRIFLHGGDSVSLEEIEAFSPEFDNLMMNIFEPTFTIRVIALITHQEARDVMEGVKGNLILTARLL